MEVDNWQQLDKSLNRLTTLVLDALRQCEGRQHAPTQSEVLQVMHIRQGMKMLVSLSWQMHHMMTAESIVACGKRSILLLIKLCALRLMYLTRE